MVLMRSGKPPCGPRRKFRGGPLKVGVESGLLEERAAPARRELESLSRVSGFSLSPGGQEIGSPSKNHTFHAGIGGVT